MASKEAKSDETPAAAAAPTYAFEFKLSKDKIGVKTTNKQVKAKVNEAFQGYGAWTETKVAGDEGEDRTVTIFFARLFAKGQPVWDQLGKGEAATVSLYDETIPLGKSDAKPSGGGATTGTSARPKKETPKGEGKRGPRKPREGEAKGEAPKGEAAKGEAKEGDRKEGGRGRGRGKKEEKKESLQRGRANIGGKLGPVSKIRLAKLERAKKEAEAKARGITLEELKKEEKPDEDKKEEKPAAKKEAPKAAGKKEAGKAEAGKKDAGKKEAPKGKGK